jgi:hypothetical protein
MVFDCYLLARERFDSFERSGVVEIKYLKALRVGREGPTRTGTLHTGSNENAEDSEIELEGAMVQVQATGSMDNGAYFA